MSWQVEKLGNICSFVNGDRGKNYPSTSAFVEEGIPFINAGNLSKNKIDTKKLNYISRDRFDLLSSGKIRKDDFLFCLRGSLGKFAIVENLTEGAIASSLVIIRGNERITTGYLLEYLRSRLCENEIEKFGNGAAQPNLSAKDLGEFKIPLPPLSEQKRIAAILDKADILRRKRQQAIQLADQFLRSVFLDLFGDPVTNQKNWEIRQLGELCSKITDGTHHSPPIVDTGIPYITAKHLKKTGLEFFKNPWFISEESHKSIHARCNPEKYDVLYIKDGATTGLAAINEYDFEFSMLSSLALLKPNRELMTPEFLCMFLNHPRTKLVITANMAGAAITRLTLAKIKEINIPIAPIHIQEKFSIIYWKVNSILKSSQDGSNLNNDGFNSLSQKAFAGEL